MKFKIKETYLLLIIVLGLVSLGIYTTYAMFTASTSLNDVVGISTTLNISESLSEYEIVKVQSNETKLIELNVINSYNDNIYYGAWYQNVSGNNIDIGLYTSKNNNPGSGILQSNNNITLLVGITNNSNTLATIYIGVKGSINENLNLDNGEILLPDGWTDGYNVTLNVINGTVNNNNSFTIKVKKDKDAVFTIIPSENYSLNIDNQTCNGVLDSNTGIYTISNIIENKKCSLILKEAVNLDTSGANIPDLVDGLIPVMYDGSKWIKADSKNKNKTYQWYDYNNKEWANAVLVTGTNRNAYQSAKPGTAIAESDILAFYVWIPRYKYKVWNIIKVIGWSSYSAKTAGIDIVFENEKESTGTINCTYNYNVDSTNGGVNLSTTAAETCTGSSNNYYTHPAFTFGSNEIRGFWIGKFELTGDSSSLTILPNTISLRNNTINIFNSMIQNMQKSNNMYGLNTSKTNTDSHMITNMEWGGVVYLTHSKYGRCTNGSCTEVTINNCSSYITGIGADSVSARDSSTTCTTAANKYNGAKGVLASTTGNITGVYDMSGGVWEYTMGNVSNTSGSYTILAQGSGFASNWYTISTAKYLTTYAYGTTINDKTAYNRGKLGDATVELVPQSNSSTGMYGDYVIFPYSSASWFIRGGSYVNSNSAGLFGFGGHSGQSSNDHSSRAILVSLSS